MKVKIFDAELTVNDEYCTLCGQVPRKVENPYINMYVSLTNACNANCKFCCNEKNACKKVDFDFDKFKYILTELKNQIIINKCSFTGGEPTSDIDLLRRCISTAKDIDSDIFTVINTNGMNLKSLEDFIGDIDSIALSIHHYDEIVNEGIFGTTTTASFDTIKSFKVPDRLHASCNLIKGYVYDPSTIKRYLDNIAQLGITDVGFVSLMPANNYCKENFVDFKDIDFSEVPSLYLSKEWNKKTYCRCRNYVYISEIGKVVKIYFRYYTDPTYSSSVLVFDGKNLREGFGGKIII